MFKLDIYVDCDTYYPYTFTMLKEKWKNMSQAEIQELKEDYYDDFDFDDFIEQFFDAFELFIGENDLHKVKQRPQSGRLRRQSSKKIY